MTRSLVDDIRRRWVESAEDDAVRALRAAAVREATMPEAAPVIAGLEVDRIGRVWAREADLTDNPTARWHVYDGAEALGYVELRGDLDIREIGPDYVLAVERDELNVESVVRIVLRVTR
jgi:hypothetical protein